LKSSIKVRRELEAEEYKSSQQSDIFESFWGEEETKKEEQVKKPKVMLKEHKNQHIIYSLEYYLSVNNPILGLVFFMNNKTEIEDNKSSYS